MKELEATIYGKVQNVGFRAYTKKQAQKLDLAGWVKNMEDGTVRCVAQGPKDDLETLADHLNSGPYFAEVRDTDIQISDTLQDRMSDFKVVR
ncbi:MAG: acylphosphatase [Parcubacteria group bacterium SW_6_46_9]|nr:MAG: acylphosphatase [Parcubacteria group bacterium SW_6_46_9]